MAEVMPMCTLCAADEHCASQRGCPGRNATGPQRIRWNWNAKYRKGTSRTIRLDSAPTLTLCDANMHPIGTVAQYEAATGIKVLLRGDE